MKKLLACILVLAMLFCSSMIGATAAWWWYPPGDGTLSWWEYIEQNRPVPVLVLGQMTALRPGSNLFSLPLNQADNEWIIFVMEDGREHEVILLREHIPEHIASSLIPTSGSTAFRAQADQTYYVYIEVPQGEEGLRLAAVVRDDGFSWTAPPWFSSLFETVWETMLWPMFPFVIFFAFGGMLGISIYAALMPVWIAIAILFIPITIPIGVVRWLTN